MSDTNKKQKSRAGRYVFYAPTSLIEKLRRVGQRIGIDSDTELVRLAIAYFLLSVTDDDEEETRG